MNKTFLIILLSTFAVANEVSVFGAGDLNSKNPYGLTKTEKHILKNKKELGSIDSKVKSVKTTIETINERIDGLESIYEGDSQKLNASVLTLNKLLDDFEINQNQTDTNDLEIKNLKKIVAQIQELQNKISEDNKKNLDHLKKSISKIAKLANKINANYISVKEFKKNMKQFVTVSEFNALKKSLGVTTNTNSQAKSSSKVGINSKLTSTQKAEMLAEAKRLFKKDYFSKAIPIFEDLLKRKYKPAESSFYLGEMWYYRKKYEDAIDYFKKSALLYDKASWMPKLLLHSAISFEKVGDINNAANFYETLINTYPDTQEAQKADQNLSQI